MTPVRPLVSLVAVAGLMCGCGGSSQHTMRTSPEPSGNGGVNAAVAKAKADSARYPYTAADVSFMTDMIGHHAQALVMAGWAPSHGAGSSVRVLAERIITAQQDDITTMRRWLRDRHQPVPDSTGGGMSMHAGHAMLMPGMLTDAQMKELDAARGPEFDRAFLTLMIQHHRGALTMVQDLFSTYGAAQDELVFKFASDVNVDQSTEIARMERMLAAMPATASSQ